ncbi:hypothetical protein ACIBTZ_11345 [Micromonospora sp. NPDC049460]
MLHALDRAGHLATQREALDRAVSALMEGNLAALLQPNSATQGPSA